MKEIALKLAPLTNFQRILTEFKILTSLIMSSISLLKLQSWLEFSSKPYKEYRSKASLSVPLKIMITSNINMLEMTLSWRDIYTVLTDLWFGLWI